MTKHTTPRRGFLAGLVSLPMAGAPLTVLPAAAVEIPVNPDQALVEAEREWLDARKVKDEATAAYDAATVAFNTALGTCPAELLLTEDDHYAVRRIYERQSWNVWQLTYVKGAPEEADRGVFWVPENLRYAIARAPAVLGRAGTTPHLIRRWRGVVPVADAYWTRHRALAEQFDILMHREAYRAAVARLDAAEVRLSETPAHTSVGAGIKARFALAHIDSLSYGWSIMRGPVTDALQAAAAMQR